MAKLGSTLKPSYLKDEDLKRLLSFAHAMARAPKLTQKAAPSIAKHFKCGPQLREAMRFLFKISINSQIKNYRKRANNLVRKSRKGSNKEAAGMALQWALDCVEKVV